MVYKWPEGRRAKRAATGSPSGGVCDGGVVGGDGLQVAGGRPGEEGGYRQSIRASV